MELFDLQTEADYWLLSDEGVGITDMWRNDRILRNGANKIRMCEIFQWISTLKHQNTLKLFVIYQKLP